MVRHRSIHCQPRQEGRRGQRGIVLLLAIIALLLISAVGAAILFMAASESGFVGSQRMVARAFYAGVGGLEEARYRLLTGLQPGVGAIPIGVNYSAPVNLVGAGGAVPVLPCTATEVLGTLVPCVTSNVTPLSPPTPVGAQAPPRRNNVLYIINSANPNPPAPNSNPAAPAAADNDPSRGNEIPNAAILTTGSIQPGAGTQSSVPWVWIRINLKTERATRAAGTVGQDLDLNAATDLDDEPVFIYLGRQYRRLDLLALDPTGQLLPAPWGPPPDPTSGRDCLAVVCASPVYVVTAYSTIPGPPPTGRIVRTEVGAGTGFSVNAGILSEPDITIAGTSMYIGYDQCDPDCPPGNPPKKGYPAPAPGVIPNCNYVLPIQSAAAKDTSRINGNSTLTWPQPCTNSGALATQPQSCIQEGANFPYNVRQLIDMLRPMATPIPSGGYTGLPGGGVTIGRFPPPPYPANLIQGTGADPQITYVNGPFKCTGGCTGAGILIVDCPTCTSANPALAFNASMEFYGLILVNGPVSVLGGGSPTTGCNIYGTMIASGTITNDVGGAICYRYNSCAQRDMFRNRPFGQLSFREIPD
ncbi:MAG TPA: hypothetical protein VJ085_06480 [Candidatus Acidoferrales bacterium]|nr:hypothetical protein [Candidatus Acidoferrales bacterium]